MKLEWWRLVNKLFQAINGHSMLGLEHQWVGTDVCFLPRSFLCMKLLYQERSLDCMGKVWPCATVENDWKMSSWTVSTIILDPELEKETTKNLRPQKLKEKHGKFNIRGQRPSNLLLRQIGLPHGLTIQLLQCCLLGDWSESSCSWLDCSMGQNPWD